MGLLQKHTILTAIGLFLSMLAVAWLQPNETGGTALIVGFLLILVNAIGALFMRGRPSSDA